MRKGSFTIEAAMILWLVMTILWSFVYLAMFLHDRLFLYETALYTASETVHRIEEPVSDAGRLEILRLENRNILRLGGYEDDIRTDETEERFRAEADARLLVTELDEVSVTADRGGVSVRYSGRITLPFGEMMKRFLPDFETVERTVSMKRRADPEEIVRLMGGFFRRDDN